MKSILIVDDDPPIRVLLSKILHRADYQTHEARNGREALEMLRADDFDVILLDLMMPDVSGFEVLDQLRRESPEKLPRIIIVTAASDKDLRAASFDDVCAVLRKPFDVQELLKMIAACVRAR